jgi:hypothetical protein
VLFASERCEFLGTSYGMQNEFSDDTDNEDAVERAIDDKREDILAADATGMVAGVEQPHVVDTKPEDDRPPGH